MTGRTTKPVRRRPLFPLIVGLSEALLVVVGVLVGAHWSYILGVAAAAGIVLIGPNRLFRTSVTRTATEVVCRYIPWYDGNACSAILLIPLAGVAAIGAACVPGHQPTWLWPGGIILIGIGVLVAYLSALKWRYSILLVSATTLRVRSVTVQSLRSMFAPIHDEIPLRREQITSIAPDIDALKAGSRARQVQITYHATTSNNTAAVQTLSIGQQLTVKPANLLHALQLWNNTATDNPEELLDRVERILCSRHDLGPDARI